MTLNVTENGRDGLSSGELLNSPHFCDWARRINRPDLLERLNRRRPMLYFCAEYALPDVAYSGGLGVLAADEFKIANDLRYPGDFIGLGHSCQRIQELCQGDDGGKYWVDREVPLAQSPETGMTVTLKNASGEDWQIKVRRHAMSREGTQLFLLQVDGPVYPENASSSKRLENNVVLGFGGYQIVKQLRERGKRDDPAFIHLNESATVFGALAALDDLTVRYNGDYERALKEIRAKTILTNHTLVDAAKAIYDWEQCELVRRNIQSPIVQEMFNSFFRAGKFDPLDLAFYLAGQCNGVSEEHAEQAARIFSRDVKSITNGIFGEGWAPGMTRILKEHFVLDEFGMPVDNPQEYARRIDGINPLKMWRQKQRSVNELRKYLATSGRVDLFGEVVDNLPEDAIILGFARRFATYKRWRMIFRDIPRLKGILERNPKAYIIMSGQPHPGDRAAIEDFTYVQSVLADPQNQLLRERIRFMPNWDPDFARKLIPACHIWLNTPRKDQEACGTSGMKAGVAAARLISVLTGFPAELPEDSFSAITGATDSEEELDSLYERMEEAIVDTQNITTWADGIKRYWKGDSWKGNAWERKTGLHIACGARMLAGYTIMAFPPPKGPYDPSLHRAA